MVWARLSIWMRMPANAAVLALQASALASNKAARNRKGGIPLPLPVSPWTWPVLVRPRANNGERHLPIKRQIDQIASNLAQAAQALASQFQAAERRPVYRRLLGQALAAEVTDDLRSSQRGVSRAQDVRERRCLSPQCRPPQGGRPHRCPGLVQRRRRGGELAFRLRPATA